MGLIFSPDMLTKVLDGSKTMTRRPLNPKYEYRSVWYTTLDEAFIKSIYRNDRLWLALGQTQAALPKRGQAGVARLSVEDLYIQPLIKISEQDAEREGFASIGQFFDKWKSLYGSIDPLGRVCAIGFVRIFALAAAPELPSSVTNIDESGG